MIKATQMDWLYLICDFVLQSANAKASDNKSAMQTDTCHVLCERMQSVAENPKKYVNIC